MINNEKSEIVNSELKRTDLASNPNERIFLTKDNFDIAISMDYIGEKEKIDPDEYFSYYIQ